jgi:hypothetical protein
MATTVKTGWLHNKNGEKFAPKTLTSQVQTADGDLLEDVLNAHLFNINYDDLAFDTTEIIIGSSSNTAILGRAILGQMVLA